MIFCFVGVGLMLSLAAPIAATDSIALAEPQGDMTLEKALSLSLARNPNLRAKQFERSAIEARQIQAKVFANPELLVDVEDALGSGPYRGMDQGQTTVQLEQSLDLGGKGRAQGRAARAESATFAHHIDAAKWTVITQTSQAFLRVLNAQEEQALRDEEMTFIAQNVTSLDTQVRIGQLASWIALRAKAEAGSARIALEWARHELDEAREGLAAQWGSHPPRFAMAVGSTDFGPPPPALEGLLLVLRRSPKWKVTETQIEVARAHVTVEQANGSPSISLRAGYRRLSGPGENAVVAGIGLPLPLFQRNQSRIQESQHRVAMSESEASASQLDLIEALAEAHDVMLTAQVECTLLRDSVLPAAKGAYESIQPGFQVGRYSHFELWEAQKAYLTTRLQLLKSRKLYHKSKYELEGLLAANLETLKEKNKP